jgi:hypothetical protein
MSGPRDRCLKASAQIQPFRGSLTDLTAELTAYAANLPIHAGGFGPPARIPEKWAVT